jgi:iron complex outermembrane receptor protein
LRTYLFGRQARTLVILCAFVAALFPTLARAAEMGTISGSVSNTATGNMLEGARVEIPTLGLSTLSDGTGRYVFSNVPAGTHEVVATYIGLDPMRFPVDVSGARRAVRDFELTSGIYKLEAFKVTSIP